MKKLMNLSALSLTAIGMAACMSSSAHHAADVPPGHYESTTTSVDATGTEVDKSKSTDVYYDANGNKKEVTDTKTTADPPGLFNKSTTETTTSQTVQ